MSSRDAPSRTTVEVDQKVMVARYGTYRSAVGSTLFAWMNLSMLLAFGWPALVVLFDLPAMGVERLPVDWFLVRFGIVVLAAVLTLFLWRSSPVPTGLLSPQAAFSVLHRGILWSQGTRILLGVSLVLAGLLLMANLGQASQLLAYGVVEVFAVQALFSGYMKTAFDILLDRGRSFLVVTGLFAVFYGLQSVALAVASVDTEQNLLLALLAGVTLGVLLGAVSLLLRDRSHSLLPGFLVHLLFLHVLIPFFE